MTHAYCCSRQGRHREPQVLATTPVMIGRRALDCAAKERRGSISYHLGESADARLARVHLIGTSLLSLDPSLSLVKIEDFETPTVHRAHFIRMGWDSFIWKGVPPQIHALRS